MAEIGRPSWIGWGTRFLVVACPLGFALAGPVVTTEKGSRTVASVLALTEAAGLGLTAAEQTWVERATLLAFKEERRLEVWGHGQGDRRESLRTYPFSASSGEIGPKLREGDGQIPEGLYRVEALNPNSSYHLSIKIDYPNAYDRTQGAKDGRKKLGFDIFVHGRAVTIGCIPVGDEAIEDLFTLVAQVGSKRVTAIFCPWDFRVREDEPEIAAIDWEADLYARIRAALADYPLPTEEEPD